MSNVKTVGRHQDNNQRYKRNIISEEKYLTSWGEVWNIGMGTAPRPQKEDPIILYAKAFGIGLRKKESALTTTE